MLNNFKMGNMFLSLLDAHLKHDQVSSDVTNNTGVYFATYIHWFSLL